MDRRSAKEIKLWVLEHAGKYKMISVVKSILKDKSALQHLCQKYEETNTSLVEGQPTCLFLLLLEKMTESLQNFKPPVDSNSFSWDEEALILMIDMLDVAYQQIHFVDILTFMTLLNILQCMVVFRKLLESSCEAVVQTLNFNLPRWTPKYKEKWVQMYGTDSEAYADFIGQSVTETRKFVLKLLINAELKKMYISTNYGIDLMKMVKRTLPLLDVVISAVRSLVGPTTIERFLISKDEDFSFSNDPAIQMILEYVKPEMTENDLFEILEILEPSESQMECMSISFGSLFPVLDEQLSPVGYANNCGRQEENSSEFSVLGEDMPPDTSDNFSHTENRKTPPEDTLNIENKQYSPLDLGPPSARKPEAGESSEVCLQFNVLEKNMPSDTSDDFPHADNDKTPSEATLNIENKQYGPLDLGPNARKPEAEESSEIGLEFNVLEKDAPPDTSDDYLHTDNDKTSPAATLNIGNKQYRPLYLGPPSATTPSAEEPSESYVECILDEDMPLYTSYEFSRTKKRKTPPEVTLNIENKQYSPPSAIERSAEEPSESYVDCVLDEDMPLDTSDNFSLTENRKTPPEDTLNIENKQYSPLDLGPPSARKPEAEESSEVGLQFNVLQKNMPPDTSDDFPHADNDKTPPEETLNIENKQYGPLDLGPSARKPEAEESSEIGLEFNVLEKDTPPDTSYDYLHTDDGKTPPAATLNIGNEQYNPLDLGPPSAITPFAEEPSESYVDCVLDEDMPLDTSDNFSLTENHKTPPEDTLNIENKKYSPPSATAQSAERPSESYVDCVLDEDMPLDTSDNFSLTENHKTPPEDTLNIGNKKYSPPSATAQSAEQPSESYVDCVLDEDMPLDTSDNFSLTENHKTPPEDTLNIENKKYSPSATAQSAERPSESYVDCVLDEDMPLDTSANFSLTENHKTPPEDTLNIENKKYSPPSATAQSAELPSESYVDCVLDEDMPLGTSDNFSLTENRKTPPEATLNIEDKQYSPPSATARSAEEPSESYVDCVLDEDMPLDTSDNFSLTENRKTPPEDTLNIEKKQYSPLDLGPPSARKPAAEELSKMQAAPEQMDLILDSQDGTSMNN